MANYIIRRIFYLIPVCFGILLVTFLIKSLIPTDVVTQIYHGKTTDQNAQVAMDNIRHQFHLDQPMIVQFVYYVNDYSMGILGISSYPPACFDELLTGM